MISDSSGAPLSVLAFIPILSGDAEFQRGALPLLHGRPLIRYTLEAAATAACVDRIVVSTDNADIAHTARELGAEVPFLRQGRLADRSTPVMDVLNATLDRLAEGGFAPGVVVFLEVTHPLRPDGLIDQVVTALVRENLDSVFAAREERHRFWGYTASGELERVGADETSPREAKQPLYKELDGLALATRAEVIRRGKRLGERIGVVPIRDLSSLIDLHDPDGFELAERLLAHRRSAGSHAG